MKKSPCNIKISLKNSTFMILISKFKKIKLFYFYCSSQVEMPLIIQVRNALFNNLHRYSSASGFASTGMVGLENNIFSTDDIKI